MLTATVMTGARADETVPDSALVEQLARASGELTEPWNVPAFARAVARGKAIGAALVASVGSSTTHGAFLQLEALRRVDVGLLAALPASQRAAIYVDSLARSTCFNTWGVPGSKLEEPAKALASLGDAAVAALKPLLSDRRSAPLWGSAAATASAEAGNRVCDYALVLVCEATGRVYKYGVSPRERDREIERLLVALEPKR